MSPLGNTIRTLRKKKGISLRQLAERVGISFTYLSKIENGKQVPSAQIIEQIAYELKVDMMTKYTLYLYARKLPENVEDALFGMDKVQFAMLMRDIPRYE